MTIYTRKPTTHLDQINAIQNAYTSAGVPSPNRTLEIEELLNLTPTTAQVSDTLAQEALHATDAAKFYKSALTQIRDAQAADAFRLKFKERLKAHTQQSIHAILDDATDDLTLAFGKVVNEFSTAAKRLPARTPLDVEANLNADTATELKTARHALAKLGTYASMFIAETGGTIGKDANAVLGIVRIPDATVEKVDRYSLTPVNASDLDDTYAVREFLLAVGRDADVALIRLARGDWPTITLELATVDEYRRRLHAVRQAHARTTVDDGRVVLR